MKTPFALILVEPDFCRAHWWQVYHESLSEELERRSLTATVICQSALSDIERPDSGLALLFGSSGEWLDVMLQTCERLDLRPIVVSPEPKTHDSAVSTVMPDRMDSTRHLIEYLAACERKNLAIFNPRPASANGRRRQDAFRAACRELGLAGSEYDDPDAPVCREQLVRAIKSHDAIICVDDLAAVYLLAELHQRGVRVPEDVYVGSFGDSLLSRQALPPLTTVTLDMREMARQAIYCALYLQRHPQVVSLHCLVANRLIIRESTALRPFQRGRARSGKPAELTKPAPEESRPAATELDKLSDLEQCLAQANDLDRAILDALIRGMTCRKTAQSLFVAESTIYYRLDRLCRLAQVQHRDDLLSLLRRYTRF